MESSAFSAIAFVVIASVVATFALALVARHSERRVRTIEHRLALLLHHFGIDPAAHLPASERVRQLAADPSKRLQAVRQYCKETGADLKTAATVIAALKSDNTPPSIRNHS